MEYLVYMFRIRVDFDMIVFFKKKKKSEIEIIFCNYYMLWLMCRKFKLMILLFEKVKVYYF